MPHKKKHHHKHKIAESSGNDTNPAELQRSSKFYGKPGGSTMFAEPNGHIDQVNVNVTVNEKQDDCLSGCFKSCFGIGKAAAK